VNFGPSEVYVTKLFNEFDRAKQNNFHNPKALVGDKRIYELSEVQPEPDYWAADFQLVTALTQMPHLHVLQDLEKRKGAPFTALERRHLELRIRAAHYWVEHYATEEEKTRLQDSLPARAQDLSATQRAFLHILAGLLPQTKWEGDALQICIFNAVRLTPIDQPGAFTSSPFWNVTSLCAVAWNCRLTSRNSGRKPASRRKPSRNGSSSKSRISPHCQPNLSKMRAVRASLNSSPQCPMARPIANGCFPGD
jgi:hypothetical protein